MKAIINYLRKINIRLRIYLIFGVIMIVLLIVAYSGISARMETINDFAELQNLVTELRGFGDEFQNNNASHVFYAHLDFLDEYLRDTSASMVRQNINIPILIVVGLVVVITLLVLIVNSIVNPIKKLTALSRDVAAGNFDVNLDRNEISKDEIGLLSHDMYTLTDVIRNMTEDLSKVYHEYIEVGNMQYAIDSDKYQNSYGEMINSVNGILYSVTNDIIEIAETLSHISEGDFSRAVNSDKWVGDWALMPTVIINLADNLNSVRNEISEMIDAISARGDLSFQISAGNYRGDWSTIMEGLNRIIDDVRRPITVIKVTLKEMQKGIFSLKGIDVAIEAEGVSPRPESYNGVFRELIRSTEVTLNEVYSYINEVSETLADLAGGNLQVSIKRDYVGDFVAIKGSINNISESLNKTMSEILAASEQVLLGASQISTNAQELANGAQNQASSVEELHASIDMINQQTQKNAASALEASELSAKSTANAQEGNKSVKEMLSAMSQIKESSNDISAIISTIQNIAFQTNLLALNASVEAARAGEHGKGFSVVAQEVRNLASRSQKAAEGTTNLVEDSISRVESGSTIAEATATSLDTIVNNVAEVSEIINSITTASQEQAEAIQQVSKGLEQISLVVQNNSTVSEGTAAETQELNSQAEILRQLVSYFKL